MRTSGGAEEPQKGLESPTATPAETPALNPRYSKCSGRAFGSTAGKLVQRRARFKVSYKREQLAEFESLHLDGRPER